MATRRIGKAVFDHGAQFFTVRDAGFEALVEHGLSENAVAEWSRGFPAEGGTPPPDDSIHYLGRNGINCFAKLLAKGLDARTGERVSAVDLHGLIWRVTTDNGASAEADALILTPPVPQALDLLSAGSFELERRDAADLERIAYERCIAVMAVLDGPSRVPDTGAIRLAGEPLAWIADNRLKGISPESGGVTIHAGPAFSLEHWDRKPEDRARLVLEAARDWLGAEVMDYQVHGWLYSKPVTLHPEHSLTAAASAPLIFAGDAFGGPRVEGAALSGMAAAATLR
jgi:predicted NAD/FAD-dependent oxidoreductase